MFEKDREILSLLRAIFQCTLIYILGPETLDNSLEIKKTHSLLPCYRNKNLHAWV